MDPSDENERAIIPIAEYGQQYSSVNAGGPDCKQVLPEDAVASEDSRRSPICVLYNGYNHYDALELYS